MPCFNTTMQKTSTTLVALGIAISALATLGLSACTSSAASSQRCIIHANGDEPGEALLPGTSQSGANLRVAKMIYSGLVYVDSSNKIRNDLAQEIKQIKPTLYRVTLRPNLVFSDGSSMTATSFVDAWNKVVAEKNANSYLLSPIVGYHDDAEAVTPLRGLKVENPTTFTIELENPLSDFVMRLSHPAFSPLPAVALEKKPPKNYAKQPVSSGPYVLESWVTQHSLTLVKNPHYQGPRAAVNDGVQLSMYSRGTKPYEDLLAGDLDMVDAFSPTGFQNYRKDLGDRAIVQPSASVIELSIHAQTPHFTGEEGVLRRRALSMAIDRESIARTELGGSYVPATGFVPPKVPGSNTSAKQREVLSLNVKKAKELWAQADATYGVFTDQVPVHFSFDISDNQRWATAVADQLRRNLGIQSFPVAGADFARFRYDFRTVRFDGAYRTGWKADYPSVRSYLEPNFATDGASNDTEYSNDQVDELLKQADKATNPAVAVKDYEKAHGVLLEELPAIPLFFPLEAVGWKADVSNVSVDFDTYPNYSAITKRC